MTLGEKVRKRRKELKMSQDELAEKMQYKSKASIHKIELDKTDLPLSKVKELAKYLHVTPQYLLGIEKKKENEILDVDLSILTEDEKKDVDNLINMTNIMFMSGNKELSENDRNTIIKAYIDVLLNKRKEKGRK